MTTWNREHDLLLAESMRWAAGGGDVERATALRHHALQMNHQHYLERIPLYRDLAKRARVDAGAKVPELARELLLPDNIFKSYPQSYLDTRDFAAMNRWLSTIFDKPIETRGGLATIDEWLAALGERGVHAVYSSGTSGNLSFVPRDAYSWALFREAPLPYTMLLLARLGIIARWKAVAAKLAGRTLSPARFQQVFERVGLRDFDGIFLNFRGGNQGIQLVGQQLAQRVRRATFLYPIEISATALRTLARGRPNAVERAHTEAFLDATVRKKDANYARILDATRAAVREGQKALVFGAPYLVKELCDKIVASGAPLQLPAGSIVGYGGGWKSFDGERLSEPALRSLIERALGVTAPFVVEAYSMTEIGALMMKCEHGRFHVPPHLETIILDARLEPVPDADDAAGILAVMDPFAVSYPGFLITGDAVHRTRRPCECGLAGETFLSVGRAAGAEIKGCGGIMATVNA
jgi:hypothetical protein